MRRFARLPNLDYVAADLDPPRGAIRLDLTAIDLPTNSVDMVICSHVLEHVVEDQLAIGELRRIVRPGGQALIMVPIDRSRPVTYEDSKIVTPAARLAAFHQEDHVRIYGRDFPERLRSAGFTAEQQTAAQFAPWARRRCGSPMTTRTPSTFARSRSPCRFRSPLVASLGVLVGMAIAACGTTGRRPSPSTCCSSQLTATRSFPSTSSNIHLGLAFDYYAHNVEAVSRNVDYSRRLSGRLELRHSSGGSAH